MSFSGEIKQELADERNKRRHCQIAELAAITGFFGRISSKDGVYVISMQIENVSVAKKYCTLLKKCFNIYADVSVRCYLPSVRRTYQIIVSRHADALRILQAFKLVDNDNLFRPIDSLIHPLLIQKSCCKRAFLRGAFLSVGSMSDPAKSYHLEFVCGSEGRAAQLRQILTVFDLNAKIVIRKKQFVVYLKDGEQIVDLLNLMGAHVALMNFENARIIHDIANRLNRSVNCDVANMQKTSSASLHQREDISLIASTRGLSSLSPQLYELAVLRMENPYAPIKELGEMLSPPIGKSGVNHRFRKINQIANEIRGIE